MNTAISKLISPSMTSMADSSIGVSGLGTITEPPSSAGMTSIIPRTVSEKAKQIEREMLMERIRSKAGQQRSFNDLSRAMRMALLEKRYALDAVEKSNLQKSLDRLQKHIMVKTRAGLVERLETLSKQLGMKFMEDSAGLFISTDMFYLEIILDVNGKINDVKVHHECKIEQTSCKELVNCLNNGDFADFTAQLEGLSAIYQLNAEPKVKTKAFVALQAMETDLLKIYQRQSNSSRDTLQRVVESSVGIALPRRGGHAMRLTYFVSPYDFINLETQQLEDLGIEGINAKQLGFSVTVNLEASSANKLQIASTVNFAKDPLTGVENGQPIFAPMNQTNSMLLPATFVLRLNKPLPVCCNTLQKLLEPNAGSSNQRLNSEATSNVNLLNLIVQTALETQQVKGNLQKGLFVNLPDSTHCYFFTEHKDMKGVLLTSVPFTEPAQVPKIIEFLKKQALFYTLITSCVRPQSRMGHDMDSTVILELNAISHEKITVSLQHPYEESLAMVEFGLNAGNGLIECNIYSLYADYTEIARKMSMLVQKSLSIPLTIRAILRYWDKERLEMFQKGMKSASSGGGGGGGGGLLAQAAYNLLLSPQLSIGNNNSADTASMALSSTNRLSGGSNHATASGGNIAGYLKYKQEPATAFSAAIKTENFNDHSSVNMAGVDGFASGTAAAAMTTSSPSFAQSSSTLSQMSAAQMVHPSVASISQLNKSSDMEIADKYKNIWKDKTTNLKSSQMSITSLGAPDATKMPPTAAAAVPAQTASIDVKRTGGIEIIPLTSANQQMSLQTQALPTLTTMATSSPGAPHSTITITPINTAVHSSGSINPSAAVAMTTGMPNVASVASTLQLGVKRAAGNDADVTTSSSSNSSTSSSSSLSSSTGPPKEKKRKKKRDDSPMGPPEKVYSRQNSPSSSPVGAGGSSLPNSALSTRPSPKHSPVYSSPKHTNTASNSPKSPFGTHSPKHGSSGKPSMSTLKSAAVTAVTSAAGSMKSSREKPPPTISTSATLGGGNSMATSTAAPTGMSGTGASGLMAPSITSKSSHLGLAGLTAPVAGLTGAAQSVAGLPQQLKSVAGLNQYLSGYGSGGGSSPSAIASVLSSVGAGDMTSASIAAASAALALRKSQGIPPPPPPPVNMANIVSGGNSGIGVSGASAAVSSMTSQQTQQLQQHQQFHHQQQQQPEQDRQRQQMLSQPPLSHGSEVQQSMSGGNAVETGKYEIPTSISSFNSSGSGSNETSSTSANVSTEYKVKSSQEGLKMTINKTNSMPATTSTQSISSMAMALPTTTTATAASAVLTEMGSLHRDELRGNSGQRLPINAMLRENIGQQLSTNDNAGLTSAVSTTTAASPAKRHTGLKPGVLSGPASRKGRTSPISQLSMVNSIQPQSAPPHSTDITATALPSSFNNTSSLSSSSSSLTSNFSRTASQTTTDNIMRLMHYAASVTSNPTASTMATPNNATTTTTNTPDMSNFSKCPSSKLTQRNGSNISMLATQFDDIAVTSSGESNAMQSSASPAQFIMQQQRNHATPFTMQAQYSTLMTNSTTDMENDNLNATIGHLSNPSK